MYTVVTKLTQNSIDTLTGCTKTVVVWCNSVGSLPSGSWGMPQLIHQSTLQSPHLPYVS